MTGVRGTTAAQYYVTVHKPAGPIIGNRLAASNGDGPDGLQQENGVRAQEDRARTPSIFHGPASTS